MKSYIYDSIVLDSAASNRTDILRNTVPKRMRVLSKAILP